MRCIRSTSSTPSAIAAISYKPTGRCRQRRRHRIGQVACQGDCIWIWGNCDAVEDRAESTFRSKEGERGCRRFCLFFKKLKTLGAATPRPAEAGPRPQRAADDRTAVDARGRAHVRRHGGLRMRLRGVAARVHDAGERDSEPRHVLAGVPSCWPPSGLQKTLLGLTQNWADRLGEVVAVDGKVLRQSFEKASERSPTHLLLTVRVGGEADLGADRGGRQVERDSGAAGTAGADRREGAHGDRGRDACAARHGGGDRGQGRRLRAGAQAQSGGPCTRTWRRIWTIRPNRRNSCRINRLGRATAD